MKKLRLLILITILYVPLASNARQRTAAELKAAAVDVLAHPTPGLRAVSKNDKLSEFYSDKQMTVMGYRSGGFAILANDDKFPAVLGYSDTPYNSKTASDNTNFKWWVETVSAALKNAKASSAVKAVVPAKELPANVAPLLATTWDQSEPYNRMTPVDGFTHTLTGCVATAMAQVLFYNRYPEHGEGKRTIYYPYADSTGTAYTVDFSQSTYDWDHMKTSYDNGSYTDEEGNAVALLMYNCGVACNMQYGTSASGAYMEDAASGLIAYFGYPATVTLYQRSSYSSDTWMQMVFSELSGGLPILYAGQDVARNYGGHAFVVDGYDNQGNVHVNWGWSGQYNGYYNIALLNPYLYSFQDNQQMILGVDGRKYAELSDTVSVSEPGSLSTLIADSLKYNITSIKVKGNINGTDLRYIRDMAGRDINGNRTIGRLSNIDLSEASIVAGGDTYYNNLTTSDKVFPSMAFANCQGLSYVALPTDTRSIGEGAFAQAIGLDSVSIPQSDDCDYAYANGVIYNKDTTRIITAMPFISGNFVVPKTVTAIGNYGMAGCVGLNTIELPAGLTTVGDHAFSGCTGVLSIRSRAKEAPEVNGSYAFENISKGSCKLFVPAGHKDSYTKAKGWREFQGSNFDNIVEFGSYIKVRNAIRQYGEENPTLGYTISGEAITGEPVLTCNATRLSPIGRYPVTISIGTVQGSDIELSDGYLVVSRAPLTLKASDATRTVGQANPDFTFTCSGLKNQETDTVLTKRPTIECEATADSPAGSYPITISGAKAANYSISYEDGTLTVTEVTDGIDNIKADNDAVMRIYNLSGQLLFSGKGKDVHSLSLKPGLYVVCTGNKTVKISKE